MHHHDVEAPSPLLHLDKQRELTIAFAGQPYTWRFRRVTKEDWTAFFQSMATEATYVGGDQVETFEVDTAMTKLAFDAVVEVSGYRSVEAGIDELRAILPPRHLRHFGLALRDVSPSRDNDTEAVELTELQVVRIDCTWSNSDDGKGAVRFTGLEHRFESPTLEQTRAYNRQCNTTRVKGSSRGGTTIYPVRQLAMIDLYDKLVVSVDDAYRVGGQQLAGRDAIDREMDACHKVAAIQSLLTGGADGAGTVPQ